MRDEMYNLYGSLPAVQNDIPVGTSTLFEAAMSAALDMQRNYNALFEAVGVDELAVYESTGSMIIYEEGKIKTLIDKVCELFRTLWQNIKAWAENALVAVRTKKNELAKAIAERLGKQKIDKKDLDGLDADKFDSKFSKERDIVSKIKLSSHINAAALKDILMKDKDNKEAVYKELTKINGIKKDSEVKEAMNKQYIEKKKITLSWVKSNFDDITKAAMGDNFNQNAKSIYKDAKRAFADFEKDIRKEYKGVSGEVLDGLKDQVRAYKDAARAVSYYFAAYLDLEFRNFSSNAMLYAQIASAIKASSKKEDAKAESTLVSIQKDLIESAFDF